MSLISFFLLSVSSLFPLVNPIGTALIVNHKLDGLSLSERKAVSLRIVTVCVAVGVVALFAGSWLLNFMGVSLAATRIGGGILIFRMGLQILDQEGHQTTSTLPGGPTLADQVVFPIAFPLTVGPGTIATLITLESHARGDHPLKVLEHTLAILAGLMVILGFTYVCLVYSHFFVLKVGQSRAAILNKVMAFFVLCIGIQMVTGGLVQVFPHLLK